MTNTALLREKINKSGYRMRFLAEKLDLSYQGFLNKVNGISFFNNKEISQISILLNLSIADREQIFFACDVDK